MHKISPLTLDSESELLLALSRTTLDHRALDRIQALLRGDLSWNVLIQRAVKHRVLPLLYRNLHDGLLAHAPAAIRQALKHHYEATGRRNLLLASALHDVIAFLNQHSITAVPYKGPTLASVIYANLSLRQFGDLDLLVDPTDYQATRELLLANGYRLSVDWGWESSLIDDRRDVCVDLHRAITPDDFPVRLEFSRLCERLQPVAVAGRPFQVLCLEDMLLVLCIQLSKDAWEENRLKLSKVCDIAELLRSKEDLDWTSIDQEVRRLGCRRMLYLGLTVAHELLGAPVPKSILAKAQADPQVRILVATVYQDLFEPSETHAPPISADVFYFKLRERWRDKLFPNYYYFKLRLIPNERDYAFLPLPDSLHHLYYIVRPFRLARDCARKLLKAQKPG